MPLYLWKCSRCAAQAQVVRKVDDIEIPPTTGDLSETDKESKCEHQFERQMCAPAIQLLGSGWFSKGGY
jgi:predicted nucleic acid-binding Zn ribbon protein